MDRPMTTEEFFHTICGILKDKGRMPDILDYGLAAAHPVKMTTYEFSLRSSLDYGGSEGIYLDLWVERFADNEKCINELGTFKTLHEDREAMHIMAGLLADFLVEGRAYINVHLDDFTWEGADVHAIGDSGERFPCYYTCRSMESALKKKDELLEKHPAVIVRDNATRKETIYPQNSRPCGRRD